MNLVHRQHGGPVLAGKSSTAFLGMTTAELGKLIVIGAKFKIVIPFRISRIIYIVKLFIYEYC